MRVLILLLLLLCFGYFVLRPMKYDKKHATAPLFPQWLLLVFVSALIARRSQWQNDDRRIQRSCLVLLLVAVCVRNSNKNIFYKLLLLLLLLENCLGFFLFFCPAVLLEFSCPAWFLLLFDICRAANKNTTQKPQSTQTYMQNKFATTNYWKPKKFSSLLLLFSPNSHEKILKKRKKPKRTRISGGKSRIKNTKIVPKLASQQQAYKMCFS